MKMESCSSQTAIHSSVMFIKRSSKQDSLLCKVYTSGRGGGNSYRGLGIHCTTHSKYQTPIGVAPLTRKKETPMLFWSFLVTCPCSVQIARSGRFHGQPIALCALEQLVFLKIWKVSVYVHKRYLFYLGKHIK